MVELLVIVVIVAFFAYLAYNAWLNHKKDLAKLDKPKKKKESLDEGTSDK